jgi:hypothetical protein
VEGKREGEQGESGMMRGGGRAVVAKREEWEE